MDLFLALNYPFKIVGSIYNFAPTFPFIFIERIGSFIASEVNGRFFQTC